MKLIKGASPKRGSPYRIPDALKEEVTEQIRELLERGLIYRCESAFTHMIVCVPKKDGSVHLCLDYCALNAVSDRCLPDGTPTGAHHACGRNRVHHAHRPTTRLLAGAIGQGFSALYSIDLALWSVHMGVMPFGLKNKVATFQRDMNHVLAGHEDYACPYLDDIAVFST